MQLTRRNRSAQPPKGAPGDLVRRRLRPEEIASGRVSVKVRKGRVEIGASPDGVARLRWQIRRGAPRISARSGALHIRARRARLILDLPPHLTVRVTLRQGDVTSWGSANELDVRARPGRFICRELCSASVRARADQVSLHFATAPTLVDASGDSVVVTVPPGPYVIDAPAGAEVTADAGDAGACVGAVTVRGADVRVLTSIDPVALSEVDRA